MHLLVLLAGVVARGTALLYLNKNVAIVERFSRRRSLVSMLIAGALLIIVGGLLFAFWLQVRRFELGGAGA